MNPGSDDPTGCHFYSSRDTLMHKNASVIDRFFAPDIEYMVNGTRAPDRAGVCLQFPPIAMQRLDRTLHVCLGKASV